MLAVILHLADLKFPTCYRRHDRHHNARVLRVAIAANTARSPDHMIAVFHSLAAAAAATLRAYPCSCHSCHQFAGSPAGLALAPRKLFAAAAAPSAARVVTFAAVAPSGYQSESMPSPHGVAYQSNCLIAGVFQPPKGTCSRNVAWKTGHVQRH